MVLFPDAADPEQFKQRALALCAVEPPGLGDVDKAAFASRKQTCAAIERMYGYLDLLDRKGSSIVTVNSFLLAITGVLLFKPLGLFEAPAAGGRPAGLGELDAWQRVTLASGTLAIACSALAIVLVMSVFHMKWGFMHHAEHNHDGTIDFSRELDELCGAAVRRTLTIQWIRRLSLVALTAICIGTVSTYVRVLA